MKTNNFRRILSILMVLCLFASLLAGCTEPAEDTKPTVTDPVVTDPTVTDPTETDPTEPTETEPTDPTETDPTDPTETEPTEPPTEPTEPPVENPPAVNITMPTPGPDGKFDAETEYIFGVGYVEDQMNNRVSVDQAVYLIRSLGVRSVRVWSNCMTDSRTFVDWRVERLHELVDKLEAADIQVIFQISGFESPELGGLTTWIPARDLTEGSSYLTAVNNFYTLANNMATEFPEVDYWEIGNEWNHNPFMHPIGWAEDGTGTPSFTMEEKAMISADLMYAAYKGIRDAGNQGLVISPAMAPVDGMEGVSMSDWLELVYQCIESGETYAGSTNKRDFFDAIAWHPYMVAEPDLEWVKNNNRLYDIAVKHGDAGIKVFLTEYGFPDNGNNRADATQAQWMVKGYELVRRYMPYVESMHYYRLFTDTSRGNDTYGLIHQPEDGFGPKAKGEAYQEMAGGKGDLWMFYMPLYDNSDDPDD